MRIEENQKGYDDIGKKGVTTLVNIVFHRSTVRMMVLCLCVLLTLSFG